MQRKIAEHIAERAAGPDTQPAGRSSSFLGTVMPEKELQRLSAIEESERGRDVTIPSMLEHALLSQPAMTSCPSKSLSSKAVGSQEARRW